MESQPQSPEFRNNPENFHPWLHHKKPVFGVSETERVLVSNQPAKLQRLARILIFY